MTKELLEEYSHIVAEISDLSARQIGCKGHAMPYWSRETGISEYELYKRKISDLKRKKLEIELFIEALPTSKQRTIVRLRVMDNLSWNEIAGKTGYFHSTDGIRKAYSRAISGSIQLQEKLAKDITDGLKGGEYAAKEKL